MSGRNAPPTIVDHIITAAFYGAVFGLFLFLVEPIAMFQNRYFMLGGTLPRIFAFLVTAGALFGLAIGTATGALLALLRRRWTVGTTLFVYGTIFLFLLFAFWLRGLFVFEVVSMNRMTVTIVIAVMAIAFTPITILLARKLNTRGPATPFGTAPRLAMIAVFLVVLGLAYGWRTKSDAYVPPPR